MTPFLLGVTQTAIGAFFGFGFGLLAFTIQQRQQAARTEQRDLSDVYDALHRLNIAAVANVEALVNSKVQFFDPLKPEGEQTKILVDAVYETPQSDRADRVQELVSAFGSMRFFYMSFPNISIFSPPGYSEYSSVSKEMPSLSLFVHRAMGAMAEINHAIASRNSHVAEHARESGNNGGLRAERILYFGSMLSDGSTSLQNQTEFALNFWRLVLDQLELYRVAKDVDEFPAYGLEAYAEREMPSEEMFPSMRAQITTFGD